MKIFVNIIALFSAMIVGLLTATLIENFFQAPQEVGYGIAGIVTVGLFDFLRRWLGEQFVE